MNCDFIIKYYNVGGIYSAIYIDSNNFKVKFGPYPSKYRMRKSIKTHMTLIGKEFKLKKSIY